MEFVERIKELSAKNPPAGFCHPSERHDQNCPHHVLFELFAHTEMLGSGG